jgi:hypothetical protein
MYLILLWDDLECGPCERQSALAVAAFGNFRGTYPLHSGLPLQLINFPSSLRVYVFEYSVHVFYKCLGTVLGPR